LTSGQHQIKAGAAIKAGFERHGALQLGPNVAVCWGWRKGRILRAAGRDVLLLERGYMGDRYSYTSIAWNGLNGLGQFPDYPPDGGKRFRSMGLALAPLRYIHGGGQYVLLVGQVPGDMSLRGANLLPWYKHTAAQAAAQFGLPVAFRPHPHALARGHGQNIPGCRTDTGPLSDALSGAAVVVTYNSNAAVDALLAGVWTVCHDAGSMAWPVAAQSLDGVCHYERREPWAHELAFKQWTLGEIASGEALVGIVDELRRSEVA